MAGRSVVITGASGLIGTALAWHLRQRGDRVTTLVRRHPETPDEIRWAPDSGRLDPSVLAQADAVVHLAGAGIGDKRWTPAYKELLLRSRLEGTQTIAAGVAEADHPVRLVTASAVGIYGRAAARSGSPRTARSGTGSLPRCAGSGRARRPGLTSRYAGRARSHRARHCCRWRGVPPAAARDPARSRRPTRLGAPVLALDHPHRRGPPFAHLIHTPTLTGPVDLVGPDPRPQREVAAEIAGQLIGHRSCRLPPSPCGSCSASSPTTCWGASARWRRHCSPAGSPTSTRHSGAPSRPCFSVGHGHERAPMDPSHPGTAFARGSRSPERVESPRSVDECQLVRVRLPGQRRVGLDCCPGPTSRYADRSMTARTSALRSSPLTHSAARTSKPSARRTARRPPESGEHRGIRTQHRPVRGLDALERLGVGGHERRRPCLGDRREDSRAGPSGPAQRASSGSARPPRAGRRTRWRKPLTSPLLQPLPQSRQMSPTVPPRALAGRPRAVAGR